MLGADLDPAHLPTAAAAPGKIAAFVEVHIEQGPVLLEAGLALVVVTAADDIAMEIERICARK